MWKDLFLSKLMTSCDFSKCKDLACDMCRQLDTHDSPFIVQGSVPADTDRVSSVSRRLCTLFRLAPKMTHKPPLERAMGISLRATL